ncbi:MAG TPA: serine hydrolase [Mycobacteriales bacterium]|nr:serine hydrolase [Mycobacteriales bacterium]
MMRRRSFILGAAGGIAAVALPVSAAAATTAGAGSPPDDVLKHLIGRYDRQLRYGSARASGLIPSHVGEIAPAAEAGLAAGTGTDGHPLYPGEVVLAARNGVIVEHSAAGYNLRYADQQGTELPKDQWIAATSDTIYDLASLSKLFTSLVATQQLERGKLALERTVASYLPKFAANGKQDITILQLMTHTSGLPADPSPGLWTYPTYAERVAAIYAVKPQNPAGTVYLYSDLNMMTLGKLVELVTGKSLDVVVRDGVTEPLGMHDTMYNPPASLKHRIAAEEYELVPDRGLVWGQVHDENSWALNGVAGHAGVFSTAYDLAILCQTVLNGGRYGRARILSTDSVIKMMTNYNQAFPGNDHGLGFELYLHWYMGALATPYTAGHTGFTGTTVVIDPTTRSFAIFLTNHVHPNRNWGSNNPQRRAIADAVSRGVAVRPTRGERTAWYGGMADQTTATLTLPLTLAAKTRLEFELWYDTEPESDFLYLESTMDDGKTWKSVPFDLRGRDYSATTDGSVQGYDGHQWLQAAADLGSLSGAVSLRWRYTTDPLYHGRGVYVDAVRTTAGGRRTFDDRIPRDAALLQPDGWTRSAD